MIIVQNYSSEDKSFKAKGEQVSQMFIPTVILVDSVLNLSISSTKKYTSFRSFVRPIINSLKDDINISSTYDTVSDQSKTLSNWFHCSTSRPVMKKQGVTIPRQVIIHYEICRLS